MPARSGCLVMFSARECIYWQHIAIKIYLIDSCFISPEKYLYNSINKYTHNVMCKYTQLDV